MSIIALSTSAASPGFNAPFKGLRSGIPTVSKAAMNKSLAGTAESAGTQARVEPDHKWVEMGQGTLVDDLTTSYFSVTPDALEVTVQRDDANAGWYRVVNPWKNYKQMEAVTAAGGTLEQTDDITIVIDATNPEYVRVMETNIGMDDSYGATNIVGYTEMVGINIGYMTISQADADAKAGKLADGVITFDQKNAVMMHQGSDYYNANGSGKFSLTLPGGEKPVDYTLTVATTTKFCPDRDGLYHLTVSGDARIPGVKYICSATYPETDEDVDATIARLNAEGTVVPVNSEITVDVEGATGSEYFIFYVAVDGEGNLAEELPYYLAFWVPDTNTADWETLGKAKFTEGFISCLLPDNFPVETYEVERNTVDSGMFRIVAPYTGWSFGNRYGAGHSHKHYIYFNAADFDNVYIMESGIGLNLGNFGEVGIGSDYYNMVRQYGIEMLQMFGITSGGTIKENVLTFDGTGEVKLYFGGMGKCYYTNLKENPDFVEGTSPDSDRYLGGDFALDMKGLDLSGVSTIVTSNADGSVEYYNLQGVRIDNPAAGGLYIRRAGGKADKIRF